MQHDHPLTIRRLVERCETVNASASCITAAVEKPRLETNLGVVAGRAHRVAHALASLGVQEGDRVATLMWNSQEHLELYLGVSSSGAVLHTLNLRLLPAQLAWIVNHAEDRVIFVDASLSSLAAQLAPECPTVRHWIVVGGAAGRNAWPETSPGVAGSGAMMGITVPIGLLGSERSLLVRPNFPAL